MKLCRGEEVVECVASRPHPRARGLKLQRGDLRVVDQVVASSPEGARIETTRTVADASRLTGRVLTRGRAD